MENNYYLIPLCSYGDSVYLNGVNFREIIGNHYPEILNRFQEREMLLYNCGFDAMTSEQKSQIIMHDIETDELLEELNIPKYLIVYGNSDKYNTVEKETHMPTICNMPALLNVRKRTRDNIEDYCINTNYKEKIKNFYKTITGEEFEEKIPEEDVKVRFLRRRFLLGRKG